MQLNQLYVLPTCPTDCTALLGHMCLQEEEAKPSAAQMLAQMAPPRVGSGPGCGNGYEILLQVGGGSSGWGVWQGGRSLNSYPARAVRRHPNCLLTTAAHLSCLQAFNWESWRSQYYRTLGSQVQDIASAGFTSIWMPPPSDSVSEQVGFFSIEGGGRRRWGCQM